MFRIISFKVLLRYVAVATTILSLVAYEVAQHFLPNQLPLVRIVSIAPWIALLVILLITTNAVARQIWKAVRSFDRTLYPDLNGTWEGEITTETNLKIAARAVVRQSLLQTQVDIHTETSKSITLETTPSMDGGQCKLYYLYRSIPKNPNWSAYAGATIFDIRSVMLGEITKLELSGYYFTDRKTTGRIRLQQTSKDDTADVSFY
jgi:SMODS-associating 2TM, beta-strand rich effector domain